MGASDGSVAIATQIKQRTDALLKKLGNVAVSSKPIVMKAEFAFCPNITIIGTASGVPPSRLPFDVNLQNAAQRALSP